MSKLTDFTQKELMLLSLAVDDKIQTCQNNLGTLSNFDDSEFKVEQLRYWNEQLEAYMLWKVQIMNAAIEVKKSDIAKYN